VFWEVTKEQHLVLTLSETRTFKVWSLLGSQMVHLDCSNMVVKRWSLPVDWAALYVAEMENIFALMEEIEGSCLTKPRKNEYLAQFLTHRFNL
jgi:hypothetical protein